MYEYRVRATFTQIYADRTYKRKIVKTEEEAEALLVEAKRYYNSVPYACYLEDVKIERRKVSEWRELL